MFGDPSKPQVQQFLIRRYFFFPRVFPPIPTVDRGHFGLRSIPGADEHGLDLLPTLVDVFTRTIPELELDQSNEPLLAFWQIRTISVVANRFNFVL